MIIVVVAAASVYYVSGRRPSRNSLDLGTVPVYTYRVIRSYDHDPTAFTQGLTFDSGTLYEGTGRRQQSTLRMVELETGRIIKSHRLPDRFFGEGITVFGDRIIQLTYTCKTGIVYDRETLEPLQEFTYETEGWGITHDGTNLIMSTGTSTLHVLEPASFDEIGRIEVRAGTQPVDGLNELEYFNGEIYANVWPTDLIARISPQTGQVTGWIRLSGLLGPVDLPEPVRIPNGIAYDAVEDRLFVTGKLWPRVYEIELVRLD